MLGCVGGKMLLEKSSVFPKMLAKRAIPYETTETYAKQIIYLDLAGGKRFCLFEIRLLNKCYEATFVKESDMPH